MGGAEDPDDDDLRILPHLVKHLCRGDRRAGPLHFVQGDKP